MIVFAPKRPVEAPIVFCAVHNNGLTMGCRSTMLHSSKEGMIDDDCSQDSHEIKAPGQRQDATYIGKAVVRQSRCQPKGRSHGRGAQACFCKG